MNENTVTANEKPAGLRSTLVRRVALACVPVLSVVAVKLAFSSYGSTPLHAGTPDAWVEVKNEKAALSLDRTSFADQPTEAVTYIHEDGSRNDWIRSGALPLNSPNITFSIVRQTRAKPLTYSLTRNLEEINELRSVRHSYRSGFYALNTRFGELRGVRFDVNADGVRKYCVGFHKPVSNLVFVKGFVCASELSDATPVQVACLLDKIHFIRPGDEAALKANLEPGEAKECGATVLDPKSVAANSKDKL